MLPKLYDKIEITYIFIISKMKVKMYKEPIF